MNSLKRKLNFYLISVVGCSFFAALFLVKIVRNLSTTSLSEIGLTFLFIVCAMISTNLYDEVKSTIRSVNETNIS